MQMNEHIAGFVRMMRGAGIVNLHTTRYEAFIQAMADAGIVTDEYIPADGQLHRFHVRGDKRGSRNGCAVLYLDLSPFGAFGSWKLGIKGTWSARADEEIDPQERETHRQRLELAHEQMRMERTRAQAAAADKAAQLWSHAHAAGACHPYLIREQIPPFRARQHRDRLVLPVMDFAGRLHSLQFIDGDGSKKLLKDGRKRGHFIPVEGAVRSNQRVLICEGWETGVTLAQIEPQALVLAAIDAGNLEPVAVGARQRWAAAEIVICADANPSGITKARAAALAAEAYLVVPELPKSATGSEFDNLAAALAGGAV